MSNARGYSIRFSRVAEKALERLPKHLIGRVVEHINALALEQRPPGCVKMAGSENRYRVRVGDYRIIYRVEDEQLIVLIIEIGHRKEIYRKK